MKRALLLLLIACGGTASPPTAPSPAPSIDAASATSTTAPALAPQPAEVTFGHVAEIPPPLTTKMHFGIEMVTEASAGDQSVTFDLSFADDEARRVELLGTKPAPKVRVTYLSKTQTKIQNGRQVTTASPVSGNTYVVTLLPNGATIDRDDKPAPRAEGEIVMEHFRTFQQRVAMRTAFASKSVRVGETSEMVAAMVRADFNSDPKHPVKFGEVTATLKGTRTIEGQRCAVFDVHAQVAVHPVPELKFLLDLHGETLLRTSDATAVSSRYDGPAAFRGTVRGVAVDAEGRAALRESLSYE